MSTGSIPSLLSEDKGADAEALRRQQLQQQQQVSESALHDLEQEVNRLKELGVKGDLNALMQRLQTLHDQNRKLKEENEQKEQRIGQLQIKTQGEMTKQFEKMLPYIDGLEGLSPESKEKVKNGLTDLIKLSAEGSGVWQVMCCASAAHMHNVNRIEQLQREATELREKVGGGVFGDPGARGEGSAGDNGKKRKHEANESEHDLSQPLGLWGDMEVMMRQEKGLFVEGQYASSSARGRGY